MPTAMPVEPLASRLGKVAGRTDRLLSLAVVGRAEVDGVLVDAVEQRARDLGQARLGVAHGGGVIAVDVAEIALPVDQRVARGEILREAHQRVVDRLVAVRMELADHVADDAWRISCSAVADRAGAGAWRRGCGDGPASARRARRAARACVMVESA